MRWFSRLISLALAVLFWAMPEACRRGFAKGLSWLWIEGLRFRRFTVLKNLQRAFPEKSHEDKFFIARQSMFELCYNFVEFCQFPMWKKEAILDRVQFHGLENLDEALKQKKGVLLLAMHVGHGDLVGSALVLKGYPLNIISKVFKNQFSNEFWFGVRERHGVKIFEPHGPQLPFDILKALKRNELVAFVVDQYMGRPYGIQSHFFGIKTGTAYGLAVFAQKTKSPVIPIYAYRDADFKTHIVLERPVSLIPQENRDLQIQEQTQEYNHVVEKVVRKHPTFWMWVHRRWKKWNPN